jgi:hypothetical protein
VAQRAKIETVLIRIPSVADHQQKDRLPFNLPTSFPPELAWLKMAAPYTFYERQNGRKVNRGMPVFSRGKGGIRRLSAFLRDVKYSVSYCKIQDLPYIP